jgi:K+ transporter
MVIITVLTFFLIRYGWKLSLPVCIAATGIFLLVDISFFGSNLLKVADGGWLLQTTHRITLMGDSIRRTTVKSVGTQPTPLASEVQ